MRNFGRIIVLTTVFCALGLTIFAQTQSAPQVVSVSRPGKIAGYYNSEKNTTTLLLGFSDVAGESPCGLYISANSSHPGKTTSSPNAVNLVILRITPEEKIKSAPLREFMLISDGQVMNLGLMETLSQQTNMDLRFETLQTSVPYESFMKIANAKNVEGKLGSVKFKLSENNLNFMREFALRLKS